MRKVAFLSMDSLDQFVCYDQLLFEPMRALGWQAEQVSWRKKNVQWDDYEVVIIRSTWDYQNDPQEFLQTLERIEESGAHLENPLEFVRWNLHKGYLRDMDRLGIRIVPSLFREAGEPLQLLEAFDDARVDALVIKPSVSANADYTFRLNRQEAEARKLELEQLFQNRDSLIQPFFPAILEEGEFSVFYFGDEYSHTIQKIPKRGDFRVQEEHGGQLRAVQPDSALLEVAEEAMGAIRPRPLYARADFVRDTGLPGGSGEYYLMELELIEPSLYFNLDQKSPARFARIFNQWMGAAWVQEPTGE